MLSRIFWLLILSSFSIEGLLSFPLDGLVCVSSKNYGPVKPDTVKGGYKQCMVYHYEYKKGKLDLNSKEKRYYYKYNDNGVKTEEALLDSDGTISRKQTYQYDDRGNIVEKTKTDKHSRYESVCNKYDDKGIKIGEIINKIDSNVTFKETFRYDSSGRLLEESKFAPDNYLEENNFYKYDNRGNIVEISGLASIRYHELSENKIGKYKEKFKYNDSGKILEREMVSMMLKSNNKFKEQRIYDGNGNIIKHLKFINDSVIYNYDFKQNSSDGNQIQSEQRKTSQFDNDGHKYKYNRNHKIIEDVEFKSDGSIYDKTLYKYDKYGNIIEDVSYESDNTLYHKYNYKWNNKGKLLEEREYYPHGKLLERFIYKYDEYGNITEMIGYSTKNKPEFKTEFIYTK